MSEHLISSKEMAQFVASGYLRFDDVVPEDLCEGGGILVTQAGADAVRAEPAFATCPWAAHESGHLLLGDLYEKQGEIDRSILNYEQSKGIKDQTNISQ